MVSTLSVSPISLSRQSKANSVKPNFRSNEDYNGLKEIIEYPDRTEYKYETEGSTGKKWGVGIASYFISGLGQAINGQWGKGFLLFGGEIITSIIAGLNMVKDNPGNALKAILATLAIKIISVVDAVNNARTEETVIVPKQLTQTSQNAQIQQAPMVNYQT